jgi:lipopolysaccharide export system permease protein
MRIFDRYIVKSIFGAFIFSLCMFLALLLAMDMLSKLLTLVTEQGVPVTTAFKIFLLRLPGSIKFALPMSMLLSILTVFNQMSSDSEMVAIRAAGVSFMRIATPALIFAVLVTGVSFWISDTVAPVLSKQAVEITNKAINQVNRKTVMPYVLKDEKKDEIIYGFFAENFNAEEQVMKNVTVIFYENGKQSVNMYAEKAYWSDKADKWEFKNASFFYIKPGGQGISLQPMEKDANLLLNEPAFALRESPFRIAASRKNADDLTTEEIQQFIYDLKKMGNQYSKVARWEMRIQQRWALPFACFVFALIASPLGLRHHRTSSAVGLGLSLVIIFLYYTLNNMLQPLGDNGSLNAVVAAWAPNFVGTVIGLFLMFKANR